MRNNREFRQVVSEKVVNAIKEMKSLLTSLLLLVTVTGFSQTKKPDSIRGQLTSYPPIDGWFIDGKFFADKAINPKGYTNNGNGIYKVNIPNTDKAWVFESLDDNKRVAIIVGDTLWVHKPFEEIKGIKEASFELRYLNYKGKVYRYSRLFFDPSYFWTKHKKGIAIW